MRSLRHDVALAENHRSDGLAAAYATDTGVVRRGNVLYIAGKKSFGDVLDDERIPLNDVADTQRHRDAVPLMQGVDVVVGHSLGGSVALSLAKAYGVKSVTNGAPVIDLNPDDSQGMYRHRHVGDPVALLDLAADTSLPSSFNTHSFE